MTRESILAGFFYYSFSLSKTIWNMLITQKKLCLSTSFRLLASNKNKFRCLSRHICNTKFKLRYEQMRHIFDIEDQNHNVWEKVTQNKNGVYLTDIIYYVYAQIIPFGILFACDKISTRKS